MNEPWNLRVDDKRTSDTKYNFIIFCEDGEIEPAYFHSFTNDNVQVNAIGNSKAMHQNVDNAIDYCRQKKLLEKDDNGTEWLALDEGTQVWCVFDRDKDIGIAIAHKDLAFDNSIQNAKRFGINVAWSNDAFELWVLMHFEDIPVADATYSERTKYYERLTDVMVNWAPKTPEHATVAALADFKYLSRLKNRYRFEGILMPLMKIHTLAAIERAKQLETHHNTVVDKPNHQKAPSTMVHHLVSEILLLGGKAV